MEVALKRVLMVIVSVCLVGGVLIGGLETASSQAPPQRTTLTFFDPRTTQFEKELDLTRKGFNAGDMFVQKDVWFDPDTCERLATFLLRGQFIKSIGGRDGYIIFDGGVRLADGTINVHGPVKFSDFERPEPFAAVIGGTEVYKDVSGDIDIEEAPDELCGKRGEIITFDLAL